MPFFLSYRGYSMESLIPMSILQVLQLIHRLEPIDELDLLGTTNHEFQWSSAMNSLKRSSQTHRHCLATANLAPIGNPSVLSPPTPPKTYQQQKEENPYCLSYALIYPQPTPPIAFYDPRLSGCKTHTSMRLTPPPPTLHQNHQRSPYKKTT